MDQASRQPIFLPSLAVRGWYEMGTSRIGNPRRQTLAVISATQFKALGAQIQGVEQCCRHRLVTGGLIAEPLAVKQADQQIEQRNGEAEFAPGQGRRRLQVAGTVDNRSFAVEDGFEQKRPIHRIVFEIGILDNRDGAAGVAQNQVRTAAPLPRLRG